MPVRRGYRQACGIARGLDIVGERWSLLIVRELLLGPKRFTDLRAGLPGASPNALTDRLTELGSSGVVRRRRLPPPAASWVYELTDWGRQLEPMVLALGTWALATPARTEQSFLSIDSLMLNIRGFYTPPDDSTARPATIVVRISDDSGTHAFGVRLDAERAEVSHDLPDQPDAVITTDIATLLGVLGDPDRLARTPKRRLTVTGDTAAARRLVAGVRPEPAGVPG
ncbi:MAG TPA: winged helix-turn-helix transcriptional regulator [Pseudonocardiaceae bacterium]|nr:winged helix-turn-helix transcriptional regulator [Pseudonocardiaceae bacterium]